MTKWEEQLEEFYIIYQKNFLVQKFGQFPHPWINYGTKEYHEFLKQEKYVNHREVFYDEIVFDIDMDKSLSSGVALAEAKKIADTISERLQSEGYSHTVWSTGGTGVHIHLFFPELFKLNNLENKIMKKIFLREIGRGFIRPREAQGRVQLQSNTLIQLEFAKHRKGGRKKLLKTVYGNTPANLFTPEMWVELEAEKEKNNLFKKHFKKATLENKPKAIIFLENEKFYNVKDGRDRALFILTAYYKQFYDKEKLFTKMKAWNKEVLGGYFSDSIIKSKIRSAKACLPMNYLIDLLEELGVGEDYYQELKK